MRTVIIDYGLGNLRSVQKAVERLGWTAEISAQPADLEKADALILPGVGAFPLAMANLVRRKLLPALRNKADKPLLGICLGLQLLLSTSEEFGVTAGLDLIPGAVRFFRQADNFPAALPVPHMGWNDVRTGQTGLFQSLPASFAAYFVHSYYAQPEDPAAVTGWTDYGLDFCSALASGRTFGVQFHPEKSGDPGLQILRNFLELAQG
ncbi:MAG: imidazole glycerol phosphate synthase subunit HisH [Candidatus Margulisbacteria bacterium]|nr:imidazole glycerol phosphate synthase subunit HisH [Candidatus Margulisiibacteriota bacterium]